MMNGKDGSPSTSKTVMRDKMETLFFASNDLFLDVIDKNAGLRLTAVQYFRTGVKAGREWRQRIIRDQQKKESSTTMNYHRLKSTMTYKVTERRALQHRNYGKSTKTTILKSSS